MDENSADRQKLAMALSRARAFLPAELSTIFWLCSFTCLFVAPSLGWWPEQLRELRASIARGDQSQTYRAALIWVGQIFLMTLPIRFAGAVVLLTGFFVPRRLARRILNWVFLPTAVSVLAIFASLLLLFGSPPSVFASPASYVWTTVLHAKGTFVRLGPGFHYALAGMLFASLACWRVCRSPAKIENYSGSALGLILKGAPGESFELQTVRFIWIMIVAPVLIHLAVASYTNVYVALANSISFWPGWVLRAFRLLGEGLFSALLVVIIVWAVGPERREVIKRWFQVPSLGDLGLAVLLPIAIVCFLPLLKYGFDRAHWATFDWGRYEPPLLSEYFRFPGAIVIWSIIPALAEEIAWRGYLQPRFIQLYGLARGIFFTGIVWGAFHFTFDFGPFMGHQEIILVLLRRLTMAVTLSVILGWITLRSGSVLPAAVVHGLYNAFLAVGAPLPLEPWTFYAIWLLTGLLLFRYWPPQNQFRIFLDSGPSQPPQLENAI